MPEPTRHDPPATAADVIRSMIHTTAERLLETQQAAVEDAPDGVHQHRTQVRRLRSVLAGLRHYLDESAAESLRTQFREWGDQLGVVRDIEVRADVAAAAMDELGIDDPAMRARLVESEREEYARAHARLRELTEGPRAAARLAALKSFADNPPMSIAADDEAAVLRKVARREARRVRRAAKRNDGSIEALHEVRKAGRRLRYVAEALHEASPEDFGEDFEELASAGDDVHDALGDHRDELVFIERLEIARARAGRDGDHVDPYEQLIGRASDRADRGLSELEDALEAVRKAAKAL